jgi:hypothetical protein
MSFIGRIYRIDFPNGYFYIGSTKGTIHNRHVEHKRERMKNLVASLKSGYLPRTRFDMYLQKHGWNDSSISLIQECTVTSLKDLHTLEYLEIVKVIHDPKNLNDRCPGNSPKFTEEQKLIKLDSLLKSQMRYFAEWRETYITKMLDTWFNPQVPS